MKRYVAFFLLFLLGSNTFAYDGPVENIFDEKLTNWTGIRDYWSFKEGVFTASAANGIKATGSSPVGNRYTFLVSKKSYGDFELSFRFLEEAGTQGGLIIRGASIAKPKFNVAGTIALGGPCVEWKGTHIGQFEEFGYRYLKSGPPPVDLINLDRRGFVHYVITAVGKRITVKLNGVTTIDENFPTIATKGQIGWYLESTTGKGPFMVHDVQMRDLTKGAKAPAIKIAEPPTPAPFRFSEEEASLFAAASSAYWVNEKELPSGKPETATSLVKSKTSSIQEAAQSLLDWNGYRQMRTVQGRKWIETLEARAQVGGIEALAKRAIGGEKDKSVGKLLEDLMGPDAQKEANRTFLYNCLTVEQAAKLQAQLRSIASTKSIHNADVGKGLKIYSEASPDKLGTITLSNQTGRTLRHVLALPRVVVDADKIRAAGEQEAALGEFLLPATGVTDSFKELSIQAGKLRSRAAQTNPVNFAYIPEIAPGAKVRIPVASWVSMIGAKAIDVSIYSDDLTLVEQKPANYYEMEVAIKYARYQSKVKK